MSFNPAKHDRRSIRLKGYDYSKEGMYFITICCDDRKHVFGKIENGKMMLNEFGKIAYDEWMRTPSLRPNVQLGEFVVMPNHVHGIIIIVETDGDGNGDDRGDRGVWQYAPTDIWQYAPDGPTEQNDKKAVLPYTPTVPTFRSPSKTIGAIVRGYKSAVTKQINEIRFGGECKMGEYDSGEFNSGKKGECNSPRQFNSPRQQKLSSVWQRNYWEHIIRDQRAFENISNYIIHNPLNWKEDRFSG